ncbi:MAG: sigma-70 family RNA polymerase sigma factor [Pyrinomonadaceae bacterium]
MIETSPKFRQIHMDRGDSHQVTRLLIQWSDGDQSALDDLMPIVYDELRLMAKRFMRRQDSGHTMQTTELIHEAYLKLLGNQEKDWKNRAHFFGVASQAMRHILVDYARSKQSQRRGGQRQRVTLAESMFVSNERSDEIVALDDALSRLSKLDDRKGRVVEMKFFGGLNLDEIAEVLKVSIITVKRDWSFARNWLLKEISQGSLSAGNNESGKI